MKPVGQMEMQKTSEVDNRSKMDKFPEMDESPERVKFSIVPKPLKVLVIQGGLTSYFRLLLERLNRVPGMQIGLVIPGKSISKVGMSVGSGVQIDDANTDFEIFELQEYKTWYGKAFFKNLESVTKLFKPDIIMTGYPYMINFVMDRRLYKRLRSLNIKFVYRDIPWNIPFYGHAIEYFRSNRNRTEDNSSDKGFLGLIKFILLTEVRKHYLRHADAHLYYTDEARALIQSYGVKPERIFISANSPDTDIFLKIRNDLLQAKEAVLWNPFRLIHIGRLVRWKRVDLILDAVELLKSEFPKIELLIAGFGPEEEILQKQVAHLGIREHVKFLGGVYEPRTLGVHLMSSGIYILAGMGGLSINDAMCFAKPVICSEADGTERRLVREDENGLYFVNGNASSLAEKIKELFRDQQKMLLFGQKSLEIIENEVNIHTVLKEYIQAFNFVTANAFAIKYV